LTAEVQPAGAPGGERRRDDRAGLLAFDKPPGITSHDVVDRVRRRLRVKSAGHLGTLDPMATGLLLVATGAATRCVPLWQGGWKTYEAVFRLGVVTASQDVTGEVLERHAVAIGEAEVRAEAVGLTGVIEQVPPMVSAIKVGGQRLYRLARRGIEVERTPRRVEVRNWEWTGFDLPLARARIVCSSGTYVRTLAHDLGRRLGCGGALESLRRLRSEPFGLDRALPLSALDTLAHDEVWAGCGLSLEEALAHLPHVDLDAAAVAGIGHGSAVPLPDAGGLPVAGGERSVVLRDAEGRVLALGEVSADGGGGAVVRPHVVFPWAVRRGRDG
jgi:tRNA pseudouridine55 synthase